MSTIYWAITDEKGLNSNLAIEVPDGTAEADIQGFVDAITPHILGITGGQVTRVYVSLTLTVAGIPSAAADEGADVEEKALFTFNTANGFVKRLTIPAVDEAVVSPDGTLNQGLAAVSTFISMMEDGAGVPLVQPVDYRGDDITTLITARKYFGRDRGR